MELQVMQYFPFGSEVKVYSLCGSGIAELQVTIYFLCGSRTAKLQVTQYLFFCSELRNFKSSIFLRRSFSGPLNPSWTVIFTTCLTIEYLFYSFLRYMDLGLGPCPLFFPRSNLISIRFYTVCHSHFEC